MKKTRLNPISKSKHRLEKRFVPDDVLDLVKERSHGFCEAYLQFEKLSMHSTPFRANHPMFIGYRCNRPAMSQPHHILARSQGGKHTLDNLLSVCFSCHQFINDHPKEAIERGLSKLAGRVE